MSFCNFNSRSESQPVPVKGRRFLTRHIVFQAAVVGLFVSVVSYLVGFCTISWYVTPKGSRFGLWKYCVHKGRCIHLLNVRETDYWYVDVTRALSSMSLTLFFIAAGVELYQDFLIVRPPKDNRAVEALVTVAAILGLTAAAVFIGKCSAVQPESSSLSDYLGWSSWLSVSACLLALLCTYAILCTRRHRRPGSPSDAPATSVTSPASLFTVSGAPDSQVSAAGHLTPEPQSMMSVGMPAATPPLYSRGDWRGVNDRPILCPPGRCCKGENNSSAPPAYYTLFPSCPLTVDIV